MSTWSPIIGGLILLSIVVDISKGRITGRLATIHMSSSPVPFWTVIALKCAVVLFVAFPDRAISLVQCGIEDTSSETHRKVDEFRSQQEPTAERE